MQIREYTDRDFESIRNWITDERTHTLWCANRFSFPLQSESFHRVLAELRSRNGDRAFVATDDDGTAEGFFCYSLERDTREGTLKFVMVDPVKRGRGLGKEMLRQALRRAFEDADAAAVRLSVFSVNTIAIRCYEGVGFSARHTENNAFRYKEEVWSRSNMVIYRDPRDCSTIPHREAGA